MADVAEHRVSARRDCLGVLRLGSTQALRAALYIQIVVEQSQKLRAFLKFFS